MKKPTQKQNKNTKTAKQGTALQPAELANVIGGDGGGCVDEKWITYM